MSFIVPNTLYLMLAIVFVTLNTLKVISQDTPTIACPDKFQYRNSGSNYYGEIAIYGALVPSIKVEAQFAQRERITTSFSDRLTLAESLLITEAKLQNGKQINFRADFPDPKLRPKLIRLRVNDRTICWGNGLPAPSAVFTLHQIFYPSLRALRRSSQFTRLINPFSDGSAKPKNSIASMEHAAASKANSYDSCGQGGSNWTSSIVAGGNFFERGRFPWISAIFRRNLAELTYVCSGSLISTRTVVSGALCFGKSPDRADKFIVYLGRHDFYTPESGVERRNIETLLIHPDFEKVVVSDADIALLQLETPVIFTQFIRPICLWSSLTGQSDEVGYVASWYGNSLADLDYAPVPKLFEVDIVSDVKCLRSKAIFAQFTSPRTLCVGKRDGTGPCIGALGAGLMVNHNGNWMLRATFSLAVNKLENNISTCDLNAYFVYCDLSKHLAWVRQNMLH